MLKYSLFLDESGTAGLNDKREDIFVLGGLIIEQDIYQALSKYYDLIKIKYKIPLDRNFHSVDFFELKNSKHYANNKTAKCLCWSLVELLRVVPMKFILYSIDKKMIKKLLKMKEHYDFKFATKEHKADKDIAYEILARKIFFQFAQFLKSKDAKGNIIAESRRTSDLILLKTFFDCKTPTHFVKNIKIHSQAKEFNDRAVSMCFENKDSLNNGLEIIDIACYTTFLKLKGKITSDQFKKRGLNSLSHCLETEKKIEGQLKKFSKYMTKNVALDRINKIAKEIVETVAKQKREYERAIDPI